MNAKFTATIKDEGKTSGTLTQIDATGIYGFTDKYAFFLPWSDVIEIDISDNTMSQAAAVLGHSKSPRKAQTSRENGKKGGRPRKSE